MNKEQQILHFIKLNPFISQQELAEKVSLSRSAVANYIGNLTKAGKIKGRAYVLQEDATILCIGSTNTDRKARSFEKIHLYASNPVHTTEFCGGVARNFAENLSRLGYETTLISAVGDDKEGHWLLEQTKNQGVDVSQVWVFQTERTGTYTTLLDHHGETIVAMADMNIYDQITPQMLEEKWSFSSKPKAVFLDMNLSNSCTKYVIDRCHDEKIPLYISSVSAAKVVKLPEDLTGVDLLLINEEEIKALTGANIASIEDCHALCETLHKRGVEKIIVQLENNELYYFSEEEYGHLQPFITDGVDFTGTNDAFSACAIYSIFNGETFKKACQFGLAGAALTAQTDQSVSVQLQLENIEKILAQFTS